MNKLSTTNKVRVGTITSLIFLFGVFVALAESRNNPWFGLIASVCAILAIVFVWYKR